MTDMESETSLMHKIQIKATDLGWRLLRNNVGVGWVGKPFPAAPGTILLKNAKRIRFGLGVGSADLIGWHTITITPEMAGQRIAVFTAVEVKTAKSRPTEDQVNFLSTVRQAGGRAMVVRSENEL